MLADGKHKPHKKRKGEIDKQAGQADLIPNSGTIHHSRADSLPDRNAASNATPLLCFSCFVDLILRVVSVTWCDVSNILMSLYWEV